jgi:hypothetical protein
MDHDFNEQEPAGSPGGPPGAYPPGAYPPGYPPQVIIEKKSNTGLILGIIAIVLLVLCALPTLAILAVTFLAGRRPASSARWARPSMTCGSRSCACPPCSAFADMDEPAPGRVSAAGS